MKPHKSRFTNVFAAIAIGGAILGSGVGFAQDTQSAQATQNAEDPSGAEVLTRGPVHEAFAGTVMFNPEAGVIVDRKPPELIEEVPPEQRLEGDNVVWIPGYWAWDEDQNDFLWISGIWRNLPPGREWVPGYWAETEGRYQWTSGYWEDSQAEEVTYLPEPPKTLETGPNIESTSDNQTWIPGNWVYRDTRYAWRPGYWVDARPNWSWTPSYYRWTRRGYVYVDGYWDYPVVNRGVVFAPVRFRPDYVARADFYYSPATVIAISVFANHLFLRPNYGHYYFGDYYEPRYRDRGFFASYSYNSFHRGYDPIYAHYRWENRADRNWERQRREYFEFRRDHADARPPRTWRELNALPEERRGRADAGFADRIDRVVGNRDNGGQRFQAVSKNERERFVAQRGEIRKFGKEREQLDITGDRAKKDDDGKLEVRNQKIGRSPVVAKKGGDGVPERLNPPMPNKGQEGNRPGDNGKAAKNDDGPNKEKGKGMENAGRGEETRGEGKGNANEETRTKPGQRREPASDADNKNPAQPKREANPDNGRKDNPPPKREANPNKEGQNNPQPKREATPEAGRKETPQQPKREANPSTERKPNPAPERKATPAPERKATPAPERKAQPAPERKRQAPQKKEKKDSDDDRNASTPARKINNQQMAAQAERKQAARPQPQSARPKQSAAQPEPKQAARTQPQQRQAPKPQVARQENRPKPAATATATKSRTESKPAASSDDKSGNRKKKKKDG